jgi:hypothetical protein
LGIRQRGGHVPARARGSRAKKLTERIEWELRWAGQDDFLAALPPDAPAVSGEPDLWEENADAYRAFWELCSSRSVGMSVGFIPMSEVVAWCALNDCEHPVALARKVRAADVVWVKWKNDEAKRDRDQRQREHRRGAA